MKASSASSLPRGKGGFNFAYFLVSELRKVFNLIFTYLSWVPMHLLRKALLALSSLKMKKGSHLFSGLDIAQGRGRTWSLLTYLFFWGLDIAWGRGRTLSDLYRVPTLEERPAEREVVSSSACLNTWDKSRALVPTPVERPITAVSYRLWGV